MSRATTLGDRRSSPVIPGDGGVATGDVRISRGRSFPFASTTARLSSDSRGSRHDAGAPPAPPSFKSSGGSCSDGLGAAGGVMSGDSGGVSRSSGIDLSDGVADPLDEESRRRCGW